MKIISQVLLFASLQTALAQTNLTFQDCRPGDLVSVHCEQPLLVLGKATLLAIGSNTVTVCTRSDRFTLSQTNVTLVPLSNPATPAPEMTAPNPANPVAAVAGTKNPPTTPADALQAFGTSLPSANPVQSLAAVQDLILGPHQNDPNYGKAVDRYQNTMNGVLSGQISQADLVLQAKEILKQCDEYAPERKKDPQYEDQIKALRDFVRRSEAGEKFELKTNPQ